MSVLVVGVSHRSAPVAVLEQLALDRNGLIKLVTDVSGSEHINEATAIATCNRLEVYAEVDRFHGAMEEISRLLVEQSGESTEVLVPHLYVHYDDGAVAHLFHVAAGLDSMVVGEGQILGQTRAALQIGQELSTIGPGLNSLFQQALRVGKRAHAETGIDQAPRSLVAAALDTAGLDTAGLDTFGLATSTTTNVRDESANEVRGRRVVVVGAGSMASLAVATVHRLGAAEITIVNRSVERAHRLADQFDAQTTALADLGSALVGADLVIACTGATGLLITRTMVERARPDGRPLLLIDLAMPHDIEQTVDDLDGVRLIDLAQLARVLEGTEVAGDIADVRRIVGEEVSAFAAARRRNSVTPTVVALRSMATGVVEAELARLDSRLPDLDPSVRAEVLGSVRRVADKLLHQPTVRVRELADEQGVVSYATALADLFALDPEAVDAVTRAVVAGEVALADPVGKPSDGLIDGPTKAVGSP